MKRLNRTTATKGSSAYTSNDVSSRNILDTIKRIPDFYKRMSQLDHTFLRIAFNSAFPDAIKNRRLTLFEEIERLQTRQRQIEGKESPLIVGVVGQFKTGKSTLINSLIGAEKVVMDCRPATAKVTSIRYGDSIHFWRINSTGIRREISEEVYRIESAHQEVKPKSKLELDGAQESFEITFPSEILRDITIVDTPGFSSESDIDDRITRSWLSKIDFFLWVFDITKGSIQSDEKKILDGLGSKNIIAVLNRSDIKDSDARKKLMEKFSNGYNFERVFIFSASKALQVIEPRREAFRYLQPEYLLTRLKSEKQILLKMEHGELTISTDDNDRNAVSLRSPIEDGEWDEWRNRLAGYLKEKKPDIKKLKQERWEADAHKLLLQEEKICKSMIDTLSMAVGGLKAEPTDEEEAKKSGKILIGSMLNGRTS